VKAFIKSKGYDYPVGYAGTDGQSYTFQLQNYLNCFSNETSVDFYGLNTYRWCGDVTYETSGYDILTQEYQNYSRPFVFTEYGCNKVLPRGFTEVAAIYGDNRLTSWLSGGFVYEYQNNTNNYGLVRIDSDTAVTEFQDFTNLQSQLSKVNPTGAKLSDPVTVAPYLYACPPTDPQNFLASSATLPPSPDETSCSCMYNSLQCVVDTSSATPASIAAASDYACAHGAACANTATNSATGVYGLWSACDDIQRASYIINSYYQKNKNQGATACNFPDQTTNQNTGKIVSSSSTISDCVASNPGASSTSATGTNPTSRVTSPTNGASTTTTTNGGAATTSTNGDATGNGPTGGNPATTAFTGTASGVSFLIALFVFAGVLTI